MKQIGIMGDTLVPGSNLLDMSIFYQTRVFRLYNDFPLLDIPTLQLNTLDTTNGALAVDIHIVNHFFSLRGCLRRIFGFSFLPNGGCGHTTSNTFVTQSTNNPVGWDVMPGGTQPNMMFMPDEQDINGWIFFNFS